MGIKVRVRPWLTATKQEMDFLFLGMRFIKRGVHKLSDFSSPGLKTETLILQLLLMLWSIYWTSECTDKNIATGLQALMVIDQQNV